MRSKLGVSEIGSAAWNCRREFQRSSAPLPGVSLKLFCASAIDQTSLSGSVSDLLTAVSDAFARAFSSASCAADPGASVAVALAAPTGSGGAASSEAHAAAARNKAVISSIAAARARVIDPPPPDGSDARCGLLTV